jgi:hypothetical protein
MRVLFYTAAAVAACFAPNTLAVKLEDPRYEVYSQVDAFESPVQTQAATAQAPAKAVDVKKVPEVEPALNKLTE